MSKPTEIPSLKLSEFKPEFAAHIKRKMAETDNYTKNQLLFAVRPYGGDMGGLHLGLILNGKDIGDICVQGDTWTFTDLESDDFHPLQAELFKEENRSGPHTELKHFLYDLARLVKGFKYRDTALKQ